MKDLHTEEKALLHRFSANKLHNNNEVNQIKRLLKQFLQGNLNENNAQEIITILATNEHCMALFEQLCPISSAALKNEAAHRLEYKIKREIQRLNRFKMEATQKRSIVTGLKQGLRRDHSHLN